MIKIKNFLEVAYKNLITTIAFSLLLNFILIYFSANTDDKVYFAITLSTIFVSYSIYGFVHKIPIYPSELLLKEDDIEQYWSFQFPLIQGIWCILVILFLVRVMFPI